MFKEEGKGRVKKAGGGGARCKGFQPGQSFDDRVRGGGGFEGREGGRMGGGERGR